MFQGCTKIISYVNQVGKFEVDSIISYYTSYTQTTIILMF